MGRERALKIVLTAVGLFFCSAVYPVAMTSWRRDQPAYAVAILLSAYVPLGILLLIAVPNPSAHRSLIVFSGWSCSAQAAVMAAMAVRDRDERGNLSGVIVLLIVGLALILLAPLKPSARARL